MWFQLFVMWEGSVSGAVTDTSNPMGFGPSIFPLNNCRQILL